VKSAPSIGVDDGRGDAGDEHVGGGSPSPWLEKMDMKRERESRSFDEARGDASPLEVRATSPRRNQHSPAASRGLTAAEISQ